MLVKEMIQILSTYNPDMEVLWHDLWDLFVAKKLSSENLIVWYYDEFEKEKKKTHHLQKKKIIEKRMSYVCKSTTDTKKYTDRWLSPRLCLFIW